MRVHNTLVWTLWGIGMAAGIGSIVASIVAVVDLARRTHVGWPWQHN